MLSRAYVHVLLPPWASPRGHFGRKYTRRNIFFFPDIVFLKIQPLEHSLFFGEKKAGACTLHGYKCKGFRCNITIIHSLHCPYVDRSFFFTCVNSKWVFPLFEVYFYFQIVFEGNTWGHFSIRQIDDGTWSF